ncbi:MAG: J domain-containing protein [Leptolyngbya sp.]|nr:J domain-containing protein [Leptolyngbya sp.]
MPAPNPRPETYYDRLGVKPTASPQQIRQAFRELSKLYHPDTTTLPEEEATEKFQQLNEAYGVLSSPDRRWTYDKQVGYSRISVMQPLEPLSRASSTTPRRQEPANLYLDPTDRPLSAGEIFALFILGLTFAACLALVVTVGLTRSEYAINPEGPEADPLTSVGAPAAKPPLERQGSLPSAAGKAPSLPSAPPPAAPGSPTWL